LPSADCQAAVHHSHTETGHSVTANIKSSQLRSATHVMLHFGRVHLAVHWLQRSLISGMQAYVPADTSNFMFLRKLRKKILH
jgi:hypothetical protein